MSSQRGRAWLLGTVGALLGVGAVAGVQAAGGKASRWTSRGGDAPDDVASARMHYANVEAELASADVSGLDPARREARS